MAIRITLDAVLRRADCSGRELQRRTGLHIDTVCRYRHGTIRTVSLDVLEVMCWALGCRLSALLSDETPAATGPPPTRPPAPAPVAPATDRKNTH